MYVYMYVYTYCGSVKDSMCYAIHVCVCSSTNALTGEGLEEAFQWLSGKIAYCAQSLCQ